MQQNTDYIVEKIKKFSNLGDKVCSKCIMCGNPIPEARLKAAPGTKYCVRCKSKLERS
jgi:RNA polymerase-binding transcription factor DksA